MTDKEQLKEKFLNEAKDLLDIGTGMQFISVRQFTSIKYLIEQAERVQELEKKIRVDSELFEKQVQINKRYREAIKKAMKMLDKASGTLELPKMITSNGALEIFMVLDKALEGEKE